MDPAKYEACFGSTIVGGTRAKSARKCRDPADLQLRSFSILIGAEMRLSQTHITCHSQSADDDYPDHLQDQLGTRQAHESSVSG